MERDNDFDDWWAKEPVSEFSGVDAGHVERAFAAGRKAERDAMADHGPEAAKGSRNQECSGRAHEGGRVMSKWKKLSQERNFTKMRLSACQATLQSLACRAPVDEPAKKMLRDCSTALAGILVNWDPDYVKKLRGNL